MKKYLALLLSMTFLPFSSAVYAADVVYGDANGDGLLTAADASVILTAARTGELPNEITDAELAARFDLDFSGILTANDATLALYKALNNGYELPVDMEMNREIQPGSLIISRMNGGSEIYTGMDLSLTENGTVFEIASKAELEEFISTHPAINGENLKDRINTEYGKNWSANQNLIIACAIAENIQDEFIIKDISVSDGALCVTMDDVTPAVSNPLIDSRLIIINVDKDTKYSSVRFDISFYFTDYDTGEPILRGETTWER